MHRHLQDAHTPTTVPAVDPVVEVANHSVVVAAAVAGHAILAMANEASVETDQNDQIVQIVQKEPSAQIVRVHHATSRAITVSNAVTIAKISTQWTKPAVLAETQMSNKENGSIHLHKTLKVGSLAKNQSVSTKVHPMASLK